MKGIATLIPIASPNLTHHTGVFLGKNIFTNAPVYIDTFTGPPAITLIDYEVYVDGEISNESIEISNSETSKAITPEQIHSLLIFHNITQDEEISKETVSEIASNFKSKYYYKTSTILTERKVTDDEGIITWEIVSEEKVRLITESITIAGHYKYNYELETTEERRH